MKSVWTSMRNFWLGSIFLLLVACGPSNVTLVTEQYQRTAFITVACDGISVGSGVIIAPDYVLTANHVTDCDGLFVVATETYDGLAAVVTQNKERDLAKLYVPGIRGPEVEIGPEPSPGDTVCLSPAYPRRDRKCGEVYFERGDGPNNRIRFSAKVEPGNSGSGLYDSEGRLVGIVTQYEYGRHGITGGAASPLR